MDWQPIETAPINGDDVLLYDGFSVVVGAFDDDISFDDFLTICEDGEGQDEWLEHCKEFPGQGWVSHETISGDSVFLNPTHWMPLPSPPKGDA